MADYVISDIHGCFDEYKELLEKINFKDTDRLYVLGDAMDRGPEPMQVILDLISRKNVTYILGNHDRLMLNVLEKLVRRENIREDTALWAENGGMVTMTQYLELPGSTQNAVYSYLKKSPVYATVQTDSSRFILVHAGIENFRPDTPLEDYPPESFLWERADYGRRYLPSPDTYLVTGHTPTPLIREDRCPYIYRENGHIAIDCGCVFGGQLAAYCMNTGKVTYVTSGHK